MSESQSDLIAPRFVKLLLCDPVISSYATSRTNELIGRQASEQDGLKDKEWWDVHNRIMAEIVVESYADVDLLNMPDVASPLSDRDEGS